MKPWLQSCDISKEWVTCEKDWDAPRAFPHPVGAPRLRMGAGSREGAPGEGNALAGEPNLGGTAQKPARKWSRAELHHLSRFISLPEIL